MQIPWLQKSPLELRAGRKKPDIIKERHHDQKWPTYLKTGVAGTIVSFAGIGQKVSESGFPNGKEQTVWKPWTVVTGGLEPCSVSVTLSPSRVAPPTGEISGDEMGGSCLLSGERH